MKNKILIAAGLGAFEIMCLKEFARHGADVTTCRHDGIEVLRELECGDYTAAVLDTFLPGLDAITVKERLDNTLNHKVKFFAVGTFDDATLQNRILRTGFAYCFILPHEVNAVVSRVNDILNETDESDKHSALAGKFVRYTCNDEITITLMLQQLGLQAHLFGYSYVRSCILLVLNDPNLIGCITKQVYPMVAKMHSTSCDRVERCIRNALDSGFSKVSDAVVREYFGDSYFVFNRARPSNSEFIAALADRVRISKELAKNNVVI